MASQSLYRKWRSQTFSDLIGQEATTRTLLNAVRDGRLAHAYLFCGPRGTGKTSAARLLAKAINCANPRDGEPCNECISCREITAGRSPDVIEIDAASNTGVDNIRELRENANLLGSGGRFKVYVIDEAHMLSTAAFNALLKTLEEPPPHVIFVLATTEAHKVLPTIVSRCQRFDFRRIAMRDIVARLQYVAQGEGLELEPAAADLLARAAQGGMRDALSLLDQAVAYCGTHVDLERSRTMLGLADPGALRQLIVAVAEQRAADALNQLNDLVVTGADLRQLQQQLGEEWRALLLARAGADVGAVMDRTHDEARELGTLASHFSLEELMACARVFARSETPARGLPVPQLALELALLECLAIRRNGGVVVVQQPPATVIVTSATEPAAGMQPRRSAPVPPEPVQRVEERVAGPTEPGSAREKSPPVTPAPARSATPPAAELHAARRDEIDELDASAEKVPAPEAGQPFESGASTGQTASAGTNWLAQAQREWSVIQKVCKQRSPRIAALLHHAKAVAGQPGNPPTIVIQVLHKFHFDNLKVLENRQMVEWAMEQVLGTPVRLSLTMAEPSGDGGQVGRQRNPAGTSQRPPSDPARQNGHNGHNGDQGANGFHDAAAHASSAIGDTGIEAPPDGVLPAGIGSVETANGTGHVVQPASSHSSVAGGEAEGDAGGVAGSNGHHGRQPKVSASGHAKDRRSSSLQQEVQEDAIVQEVERELGIQLMEVLPVDEDDEPF